MLRRFVRNPFVPVLRSLSVAVLLLVAGASSAAAQEWARKMFVTASHDFGTLARGSKAEFAFELENIYEEEVRISGVRTSCGCTTPTVTKSTLKTWEKSTVVATFHTDSFLGQRNATITVSIDRPYAAEVQLTVKGFVRSDVVFNPGVVEFGSVDEGATSERKVAVTYAGRGNWAIVDVRSTGSYYEVEMAETARGGGKVAYELTVRLKPNAPAGFLAEPLILVTNDDRAQQIPISVTGRVASALTVSPASLFVGVVAPGGTVTKQIVVKGKTPFRITRVSCGDDCFQFPMPGGEAKTLHFVPVTFRAGSQPGKVAQTIEIETDLNGGAKATCLATATVQ
jgi:hypothetical protein